MAVLAIFLCLAVAWAQGELDAASSEDLDRPLYPSPIIDMVNSDPNAGWKAGVNERFINYTLRDFKKMGGALVPKHSNISFLHTAPHSQKYHQYDYYDARTAYNCPSMRRILDQGTCGACWAFAPVQVLMDRFCIFYQMDVFLSVNDVLSCCNGCGSCDLGYLERAWDYLRSYGTVSWNCNPYFDTTACPSHGCKGVDTPQCVRQCANGEYWQNSKYFAGPKYRLWSILDVQNEIIQNGPVTALMKAYEDFSYYKGGVYRYRYGNFIINHFIKLVGWGVTPQGEKYWQATNQWSTGWGESGHFKIAMGTNEVGIESYFWAAQPVYRTYANNALSAM